MATTKKITAPKVASKTASKTALKTKPKAALKTKPKAALKTKPKAASKVAPKTALKTKPKVASKTASKATPKVAPNAPLAESPTLGIYLDSTGKTMRLNYDELFTQVLKWFIRSESIGCGHDFTDTDAEVHSYSQRKPSLLRLPKSTALGEFFYHPVKGKVIRKKNKKCYGVATHKALPQHLLTKRYSFYRNNKNLTTYGPTHYFYLNLILSVVETQFDAFTKVLNAVYANQNVTALNYLTLTTQNLNRLILLLEKEHEGYYGIQLPDLQFAETRNKVLTYNTLMFSKETSSHFCMALCKLLQARLLDLEKYITVTDGDKIDEYLNQMPHFTTKEKMKLVVKILKLKDELYKVSWGTGELILFFRALQQMGVIQKELDKNKMALALRILTGKSEAKFLNDYVGHKSEPNLKQIFEITNDYNKKTAKTATTNLANEVIKKMHELITEVQ